jgi:HSP20 family protein
MLNQWLSLSDPIWENFDNLQREMERMFQSGPFFSGARRGRQTPIPAVNIGETPDQVIIYLFAPGLDPKEIELTIEKNTLTISAGRDTSKDIDDGEKVTGYYRKERFSGNFRRVIALPEGLDTSQVEAKYVNGILIVSIKKKEEEQTRKIEVKVD